MQPAAAHAGHKHFNFQAAARHVTYDGKTARIEYVDTANRTVVSVPPAEYETTGFDGSWDNAYYVTPPSQLKRLAVAKRGDVPGTRWYEQAVDTPGARGVNRILWSETLQAPLSVEYRSADGRVVRKLTLTPAPPRGARRCRGRRSPAIRARNTRIISTDRRCRPSIRRAWSGRPVSSSDTASLPTFLLLPATRQRRPMTR